MMESVGSRLHRRLQNREITAESARVEVYHIEVRESESLVDRLTSIGSRYPTGETEVQLEVSWSESQVREAISRILDEEHFEVSSEVSDKGRIRRVMLTLGTTNPNRVTEFLRALPNYAPD